MKILLHACCAPCSAPILEKLMNEGIKPAIFYYNPNIFPKEEYEIRRNECEKYSQKLGIEMIEGPYEHEKWLEEIKGFENEPERGGRCLRCFKMRLKLTAKTAQEKGFDTFASSLSFLRVKPFTGTPIQKIE